MALHIGGWARILLVPTPLAQPGGDFINVMIEARASENRIRLNGDGLAVADVNGDGLPDAQIDGLESSGASLQWPGCFMRALLRVPGIGNSER